MWNQKGNSGSGSNGERKDEAISVAIDKDKGSQYALKWAVDHLLSKGQTVTLIHVKQRPSSIPTPMGNQVSLNEVNDGVARAFKNQVDTLAKELFLPYRAFCTRKEVKCNEVILEDMDISRAICEYVKTNLVETLVLGVPSKSGFVRRFKASDVPTNVSKGAPEFCSVYVISKTKISSVRSASIPMPNPPPRPVNPPQSIDPRFLPNNNSYSNGSRADQRLPFGSSRGIPDDLEIESPFNRHKSVNRTYTELSACESDISFVSSGRPSTERMLMDSQDYGAPPRLSYGSDASENISSFSSPFSAPKSPDYLQSAGFSSSFDNFDSLSSSSSQNIDEVEAEMRRLKQELKQTMDMYSTACKEALNAKQKAMELHRWKMEEQQKLEEARVAHEAALVVAEKEKMKTKAAIEAAEAAQRIAELEAQKRVNAEMKALREAEEKKKALDALAKSDVRYRKYSIEEIEAATENFAASRKIGEGGYGPVYYCYLDHTPVAIKVLRPDAAQGRSQFQQEVEVLSCIRHPNMVLLLGACPEFGCLVYEYMANGSLEDRLFRRGDTPVLPWQLRFRIAAEIATGLLFLHQTKPEPLVHRDLKPANILLDRNFVSKISDVGLARLVPPSVANSVTQYRMTSTAGTFCYIDPEYQQTGMLGIKSDIYSLGIMLLQIITAKPAMGLTHHVERAMERGTFEEMLDPFVTDWPVEEARAFGKIALKCAELRRKDRPDLKDEILPQLNRLRAMAEESMPSNYFSMSSRSGTPRNSSGQSQASTTSQDISDPMLRHFGSGSSQSSSFNVSYNQALARDSPVRTP